MDRPEPTNQHGHPLAEDGVTDDPTSGVEAGAEAESLNDSRSWGIRRLRVAQPPAAGRPRRAAPAATTTRFAGEAVGPDPVTMDLFASPAQAPHRPGAAPPTAWRTVSTVSVLQSVLPPAEPPNPSAPPQARLASELRAAILGARVGPVEDPPPATTVAVVPGPAQTGPRTQSATARRTRAARQGLRWRALWIFVSLVGAVASSNRRAGTARGRRDEPQNPSSSAANASVRNGDGAAGS